MQLTGRNNVAFHWWYMLCCVRGCRGFQSLFRAVWSCHWLYH